MPKDIVGAIANEAGIESQNIGRIKLNDDYSTVDLPEGMPNEIFQHLKNKVRVCQQPMKLSLLDQNQSKKRTSGNAGKSADKAKPRTRKPAPKKSPSSE
ncbi:MAG: DbpA RNA binding domain-containing protein [Porticoccus sp.]|nr:DbpA RNA binding domain-containing protein [Porticoccus sp.]